MNMHTVSLNIAKHHLQFKVNPAIRSNHVSPTNSDSFFETLLHTPLLNTPPLLYPMLPLPRSAPVPKSTISTPKNSVHPTSCRSPGTRILDDRAWGLLNCIHGGSSADEDTLAFFGAAKGRGFDRKGRGRMGCCCAFL